MRSLTVVLTNVAAIAAASLLTLDARQATPPAGQAQAGTANPTAQTPLTAAPRRTEADARAAAERNRRERELQRQKTGAPVELISNYVKAQILPVPASLGVNAFYTKYVDAQGIPVISSDKVPDDALLVARDIINSMLAKRLDLRAAMIARKWRTGVIAEVEMTMDIPEYSRMKRPGAPREEPVNQEDRDYHANRSRGLGGNPTTGAEENLLGYPGTRYFGEHIFVHEFAHAIMTAIRDVDPKMHADIGEAYKAAMAAGKYLNAPDRKHYATTNAGEYWAEGVQWWFFSNFGECFTGSVRVDTPEEFAAYDPALNELISRVFDGHRIPMDVFHGKRLRKLSCGSEDLAQQTAIPATALPGDRSTYEWRTLFNGKDLAGWTPKFARHELGVNLNDTFRVVDGLLQVRYDKWTEFNGEFGHLFYQEPFSYYVIAAEYRFVGEQMPAARAHSWAVRNNGFMLHSQEPSTMLLTQDFPISIEVQFLGGLGAGAARPTANLCTPGTHVVMNGQLRTPHCTNSKSKTYDGDVWVRVEVLVLGDEVIRHVVDGETVLEYSKPQIGGGNAAPTDPAVKIDGTPLTRGFIAIQSETAPTDFRKIEIVNLEGCADPKARNYHAYIVKPNSAMCRY